MNSSNKIAIFGCKSTTKSILSYFIENKYDVHLITIDEDKGASQKVADYIFLKEFCDQHHVKVYIAEKYSLKSDVDIQFFKSNTFQIGFVVGWQRLIPEEILKTIPMGVFGMHGSPMNLPKGRGRSPMNWSILEGRKVFYTNLFQYKAGADDGDVLDTFKFQITDSDTAETMHYKNTMAMKFLIKKNIQNLCNGEFALTKQPDSKPTYYPSRNAADGLLDWEDDIYNIEKLVRAVTKPFDGAYTFLNTSKVTIYRASVFDIHDFGHENACVGQVVEVFETGKFLVKGYGGLLIVHEYMAEVNVLPGAVFSNNGEVKKIFAFNRFGFHDLDE
jgi:methionyl-tRNA formyltransferase